MYLPVKNGGFATRFAAHFGQMVAPCVSRLADGWHECATRHVSTDGGLPAEAQADGDIGGAAVLVDRLQRLVHLSAGGAPGALQGLGQANNSRILA